MAEKSHSDLLLERVLRAVALLTIAGIVGQAGLIVWGCEDGCVGKGPVIISWALAAVMLFVACIYTASSLCAWLESSTGAFFILHSTLISWVVAVVVSISTVAATLVVWDSLTLWTLQNE